MEGAPRFRQDQVTSHLPYIEQWSQSSGCNVIPRRARPGFAGLRPHKPSAPCLVRLGSKVDGVVPETSRVDLRIVGQPDGGVQDMGWKERPVFCKIWLRARMSNARASAALVWT